MMLKKLSPPLPSKCNLKHVTPKIPATEWKRLKELHLFETAAREKGFQAIAGVDEAGRGPLAGPVVAAACIIPEGVYFPYVDDSKKLVPKLRKEIFLQVIGDKRVIFGIGIVCHKEIDRINILQASIEAMFQAIAKLAKEPDYILVDGVNLTRSTIPHQKIIRGDQLSHSIAVASVLAKETRDRLMEEHHNTWPQYGFNSNKGYGTAAHLKALAEHGPCEIHRQSFAPVKDANGHGPKGQSQINNYI